jgi:hypothetical protein
VAEEYKSGDSAAAAAPYSAEETITKCKISRLEKHWFVDRDINKQQHRRWMMMEKHRSPLDLDLLVHFLWFSLPRPSCFLLAKSF